SDLRKATGFVFKKFDADSLYQALEKALFVYYKNPKIWRQLQVNGMKKDFSWDKSAKEYLELYSLLRKK
ncbi:starch synthase, partial [Candidatus Parcubacteria bacterium]|nr:starch synthase [Candidatus Parcubacteria bacterium]